MSKLTQQWKDGISLSVILWLSVWVLASWMLYNSWKGKTPWPLGAAMPF